MVAPTRGQGAAIALVLLLLVSCREGGIAGTGATCRDDQDCRTGYQCMVGLCRSRNPLADAADGDAAASTSGGSDAAAERVDGADGPVAGDVRAVDAPPDERVCSEAGCAGAIVHISAGGSHTCLHYADRTIDCFGGNWTGQAVPPPGQFRVVAAGGSHTCALRLDGTLLCWGGNDHGQATPPAGVFETLVPGQNVTCALDAMGQARCWGELPPDVPAPAPTTRFTQIAPGQTHVCGLNNGVTRCWGGNEYGESVPPKETFVEIGSGANHSCGRRPDGTLVCWGSSFYFPPPGKRVSRLLINYTGGCGQEGSAWSCWGGMGESTPPPGLQLITIGIERGYGLDGGRLVFWGPYPDAVINPPMGPVAALAAANGFGCVLSPEGKASCWNAESPLPKSALFERLSIGVDFVCGLLRPGRQVLCWGNQGATPENSPPGVFVDVGAGRGYACALRADGFITCWGEAANIGTLPAENAFEQLAVGPNLACGRRQNGLLACWGPGQVKPPSDNYISLSVGDGHACALRADHTVQCWGRNVEGQAQAPPGAFTMVSAGYQLSCGLRTDQSVVCWGSDAHARTQTPKGNFVSVAAGGPCAQRIDGRVICWGPIRFSSR